MPTHDETQTSDTKRAFAAESSHLAATTTQLQQEANAVEDQNERLRELFARKQALAERLERVL
jgi:hypothetical protein